MTVTPAYDYSKYIRCYCCMDICPEAAIFKKNGRLRWLLHM
jgi:Pyruvate/2-oxoacid:ferredoxin oxidoreductase delta subunit